MRTEHGTITIPSALLAEIELAADEERRPVADMLREIIERGLDHRRWVAHSEKEWKRAEALGEPIDSHTMSEEYREVIRGKIAQGIASAKAGMLVDGEPFMAQMLAELHREKDA